MQHKKQVMLNALTVMALLLAAIGVAPAGASIPPTTTVNGIASSGQHVSKPDPKLNDLKAVNASDQEISSEPAIYMIRLADPPLVAYTGGIAGLKATSPQVTGARKLNVNSPDAQAYSRYLADKRAQAITAMQQALKRSITTIYEYYTTNNGLAVKLTPAEAEIVAKLPGVIFVQRDYKQELQTDVGPTWIGADSIWNGSATGVATKGEGVIVGVIDTGINHASPSFADIGGDGYNHTNPRGAGSYVGYCVANPSFCNDKLIGAWNYPVLSSTPEDADGHGSHTASTAAGNVVTAVLTATSGAVFTRTISGVAPHANVIAYAACCDASALAAAIDQTVIDGVDVINYSIGSTSPTPDPWADFDSVGFLNARNAGIFVANSAGNSGPGAATLGSPTDVPWLTSVAASTHNRAFLSSVISATGGITTPPPALNGRGMSNGLGLHPVVYAGAAPYNDRYCQSTTGIVYTNTIVVCDRGVNGRVEKGVNVQARGGVGLIMTEIGPNGPGFLTTDSEQPIPAVYLTTSDGDQLKAWLAAGGTNQQVAISPTVIDVNPSYGDIMASFSSRGQNLALPDIIAPSVTAPGVAIFAAYKTPEGFAVIQGTSMSSPHVAGAAALMVALHPTWTPAEIQSALMTTARTSVVKEDGVTPANPFDMGSGRVDLSTASRAGFVLDETYAHYIAANPAIGGDVKTLNLASFGNASCVQKCKWTRTLTSVLTATAQYTASVTSPAGITVTVTPVTFTLGAGASRVITVTVDVGGSTLGVWKFAQVNLDGGSSIPAAHLPVAVKPSAGAVPAKIDITTPRDSGSQDFSVTSLEVTTLTRRIDGLVPAVRYTDVLTGDTHVASGGLSSALDNPNDGVKIFTTTLTTNDVRLHGGVVASTAGDMDLYLVKDTNGDGFPELSDQLVAQSASAAVLEQVDVVTTTGGTYFFVLQNFNPGPNPPSHYTFEIARVSRADAGNAALGGPTSAQGGTPYTLTLTYDEPALTAGDNWYGLLTLGTDPGNPGNIGQVMLNIHRIADEVSKTASPGKALPGQVVTYTIVIKNSDAAAHNYVLTDVLPAGVTYVPGSVTGPAAYNAGLNAILISATVQGQVKSPNYVVEDSLTNPNLVSESPTGGFLDLLQFGTPGARADNSLFFFADVGCPFAFYDSNNATPNGFQFATNGLVGPRNGMATVPGTTPAPIPTAADPNAFIAVDWGNLSITNTLGFTNSGRLAFVLSNGIATCPSDYLWALQYHRLHSKTDANKVMDVQYIYDFSTPDVHWVQYGPVSGNWGTAAGDVVGAENFAGNLGVAYTGLITSGLVLRYSRPLVAAPPITVTFQVTVGMNAPALVVNTVNYTVDVPNTVLMGNSATFNRDGLLFLPVIRRSS